MEKIDFGELAFWKPFKFNRIKISSKPYEIWYNKQKFDGRENKMFGFLV